MKKLFSFALVSTSLLVISTSFSSCDKLKEQVKIPDIFLKSKDIVFDIPPTAAGSQIQSADVAFDINAEIKAANNTGFTITSANIKKATVSKVSIDITSATSPTNNATNFAAFTAGGAALIGNMAPNKITVAQVLDNPDVYSTHLDLPITGTTDVTQYLKSSVISYVYGYTLRRATTVPLKVVMHVEYDIEVAL